jgi:hypothetical protein
MNNMIAAIVLLVVGAVMLIIGLYTEATIYTSINTTGLPAATVTAIANVQNNVTTAFTLTGVGLIVVGAAFIIRTLISGFTA